METIKRIFPSKKPTGKRLKIEVTTKCNQKCYFCPQNEYSLRNKTMSNSYFFRIIDCIQDLKIPIYSVSLGGMGEPLMDPDLFLKARYAKKLSNKLVITTNGKLITEDLLKEAKKVLTKLYFSFHGNTLEEYELYSGNDFEEMKEKVLMAKEILGNKLFLLNYPEGKLGKKLGVAVSSIHPLHNWGNQKIKNRLGDNSMSGCKFCGLTHMIYIRIDGSFSGCGNDWSIENKLLLNQFPKCVHCHNYKEYLRVKAEGKLEPFIRLLQRIQDHLN